MKTINNDYLLKAKLQERDDVSVTLRVQVMKLMAKIQELKGTTALEGKSNHGRDFLISFHVL